MKITKLGHCCLIIDIRGVCFLTDPGNYTTAQNEVSNIHFVVISHEHTDHLHIESLKTVLKNNPGAKVITNNSVGKILDEESIKYIAVSDGENFVANGVRIRGLGTKHAPIFRDYEQVENTGYLFDEKMFYPGDSLYYKPDVPVDILAFPVTGPWCKISDAMDYVLEVKPRVAIPVHDGNLIRHGITNRLPNIFLTEAGIQFIALELGKETEL
jgi:L-ascorbate metabolism protein UlaG (beta-lactamase superfamily)